KNSDARNLVRHGSVAAALVEHHRRVIRGPGKTACKRQSGFVPRTVFQGARLHAANRLADHLVRPGARAASRFVRSVEHDHHVVFRGILKKRFVKVDHFFGLMIEKINLRAGDAQVMEHLEELFACFPSTKLYAMFSKPDAYAY